MQESAQGQEEPGWGQPEALQPDVLMDRSDGQQEGGEEGEEPGHGFNKGEKKGQ